jgi:hypothetical protein
MDRAEGGAREARGSRQRPPEGAERRRIRPPRAGPRPDLRDAGSTGARSRQRALSEVVHVRRLVGGNLAPRVRLPAAPIESSEELPPALRSADADRAGRRVQQLGRADPWARHRRRAGSCLRNRRAGEQDRAEPHADRRAVGRLARCCEGTQGHGLARDRADDRRHAGSRRRARSRDVTLPRRLARAHRRWPAAPGADAAAHASQSERVPGRQADGSRAGSTAARRPATARSKRSRASRSFATSAPANSSQTPDSRFSAVFQRSRRGSQASRLAIC